MVRIERSSPCKVQFESTDGLAAGPLRLDINSKLLKAEQSVSLRQLIMASELFNLSSMNMDTAATRDHVMCVLTLETADVRYTLRTSEGHALPQLNPVIDYLTRVVRKFRRGSITS